MTPTTGRLPTVDYLGLFRLLPTGYLVMTPDFVVVDANDAYLASVGRTREEIVGQPVFEAFPPSDDALDHTGVSRVQRSFERARDTGRLDAMPVQRYDIPDLVHGGTVERFWSLISVPVPDREGRTVLVVQRAEDVTDFVRERQRTEADRERGREWRRRIDEVEADLFARAEEVQAALRDRDVAARQLASLAHVALLLTSAETLAEVEQIVVGQGMKVLGADGGAVVTPHPDGGWQVSMSAALPEAAMDAYQRLPYDSPLPACWVARTGQRLILPTRDSGLRFHPVMAETYENTRRLGWALLPLRVGDKLIGSLAVAWAEEHAPAADELELLDGFAAQLALALERIWATEAQRAAAAEAQQLSETLQRSLLTQPTRSDTLEIAVRYQPAAAKAHIGGDWYDAFATSSGGTVLVVGDVNGHDRTAAALMGQLRNLVRGMAYDSDDSPAELLSRLDGAMRGLGLDTLATAVLARVEQVPGADVPVHRLRWSNAGHLPPVLRTADGEVRVLEPAGDADLLLGWDPGCLRTETVTDLPPGSTLVLYTDGLVERRDAGLDEGIARLVRTVQAAGDAPAEDVAERILRDLGPDSHDDDVALLVLRGTGPA
ncbi:SpoIIE family protein phosphatase [uncultured Cellulomonas sp.]|uniref:SpoIIE family protein phosphatase n=1 Tax=uncultured Cellulomonas sp. TaxID=189682 RepID=UPI0026112BCB|nr:SpoIIE family protein phosphatase [uncultured Cellulomonas sp.]